MPLTTIEEETMERTTLNYEDAIYFVENELKVVNFREKLTEQRHQLLNELIRTFHAAICYTSFYLHSEEIPNRRIPYADRIVKDVLTHKAGTCSALNGFFYQILLHLGYDVIITNGTAVPCPEPNNHVVLLVKNLDERGGMYYVDVGMGFPTFEAISLDDLPVERKFAFHEMRLEKRLNGTYMRCHRPEKTSVDCEEWVDFCGFGTTPRRLSFFDNMLEAIYMARAECIINVTILACLYPLGRSITLMDFVLKIGDLVTNDVDIKQFESIEEAANQLPKHFPMLDKELITRAYTLLKKLGISDDKKKAHDLTIP